MAAKKTAKKAKAPKSPGTKRRRGVSIRPTELGAPELADVSSVPELGSLATQVESEGGAVLARYREPLGGNGLLLVALPIEKVSPTPFQRDVSDAHVRKLTRAMDKTKRFLDPLIVVAADGKYWTPNGNHRLTALRELGAKSIVALLVPQPEVAYQILALNIEKAHSLRERALEVVRMYRELAGIAPQKETEYELEFEEPALVTLGFAYQQRGRLAGGAYHPILRKVDGWLPSKLDGALEERERRAGVVLAFDDAVNEAVQKLKDKGLTSPYLKNFVVSRVNPLRFIKGDPPPLDELFQTMTKRARGMKMDNIKNEDLARSGGAPDED
ncbi:MAG TPA: ParB N-terminal domain-containing protein [Polyangiaceae bacterium]|nr:ParB N-terminal domain-containing protein [Polyangiaceae bacterium]